MQPRDVVTGWPWYVLITASLAVLLALIGPFGTFAYLSLPQRLAYWLGIFAANGLQVFGALLLMAWWRGMHWPPLAIGLAAGFLASIPATVEVVGLELLFRPLAPVNWATTFGNVLLLTEAITVTIVLVRSQMIRLASVEPAPVATEPPAERGDNLMRRIKPEARGALWALEMEDHYLRVYTSTGNDLILHRLSDALGEVAGLDGMQVHRSYWVAREAVQATERDGRKLQLVLKNGLKVPVSRNNVAALRAAGWV
jgi:DNA-binding LytR/AlgR family response regulator